MPKRDDSISLDALPSIQAEKRLSNDASKQSKKTNSQSHAHTANTPWFLWCVTVCLLIACVSLSFYSYQQQQTIEKNELRLAALEGRLSNTDESLSQSSVAMQLRLVELKERTDELWTQMDKLWASAWRRNQTELKDLSKQFAETQNQVSGFAKDNTKYQQVLADLGKDLKTEAQKTKQLETNLTKQTAQVEGLKDQAATIEKQLSQMKQSASKLAQTDEQLAELKKQQQQLQQQMQETHEWIESNNAFRKKTNQTLNLLDARMKSLHPAEDNPQ